MYSHALMFSDIDTAITRWLLNDELNFNDLVLWKRDLVAVRNTAIYRAHATRKEIIHQLDSGRPAVIKSRVLITVRNKQVTNHMSTMFVGLWR